MTKSGKIIYGFWDETVDFPVGCGHKVDPPICDDIKDNINEYELWIILRGVQRWGAAFRNHRVEIVDRQHAGVSLCQYWSVQE